MIPREYHQFEKIQLYEGISLPSKTHAYSLAVEYIRNWFLNNINKVRKDYFKTVYINGKHVFDDYRRFNRKQLTTLIKPAVSITPSVDHDYNRDYVDLKLGGLDVLTRRSKYNRTDIIQDYDHNIFLQMTMELIKVNFAFRMRVSTRAQQFDLANCIKFAHRVGSTQKEFISCDFHLPYESMINIARTMGYEIIIPDDKESKTYPRVKNIYDFLSYLNSHSVFPISYKLRTVNGNSEFFIRVPQVCVHVDNTDNLSLDDGEREDQIDNNFHIEMNCTVTFPVPQEYFFYSKDSIDESFKLQNDIAGLYTFRDIVPPDKDENGWTQYISTEYVDEENYIEKIEFGELIEGSILYRVIEATKDMHISPSVFMNIIVFNAQYRKNITVDWDSLAIIPKNPKFKSDYSQITIYVDQEYMNNQLHIINENRENKSDRYNNDEKEDLHVINHERQLY